MTLRSMAKYNKASQIQPSRSSENSITAAETSVKTNGAFQTRREPLIQAHDTSSQFTAITNTQSIQLSSVSSTPAQRVKMVSSLQREDVWEPKLVTAKRMLAKNQHQDTSNTSRYENNQDDSKVVTKKKSRGRKNLYFSIKPQQSLGIKTLRVTEGKKKGATFHDLLEATIIKCSERLQESQ
uniref:Uncharacterized protein LOC100378025 n=1 Tax=Saccoglossus kowalevskii TaxID=10224 RepID=A0ABM0MEX3_SACKO|nr:PREDICTED: uncharacterized protein LOC100378025 [Saccoglossus kowalevskii]